jgi:hypothetical protein
VWDGKDTLLGLIRQHLSWYPLMELRDIYKLLFQAVMGSGHLITSPEQFTLHLHSEFVRLVSVSIEPLFVPVRPDQTLMRLNLRPYKSRHLGINQLILPLLETAQQATGGMTELKSAWMEFLQLCEQGRVDKFSIDEIHHFSHWLDKMEFPLVHHSEIYRREYQPVYRLISAKFIPKLGLMDAG